MKYVGIDLHKKVIVLCAVGQDRKVLQTKRFLCIETDPIREYFGQLGPFEVVIEATASYDWLVDLLLPLAKRVVLAHPGKLRVIAESVRKSDKVDAKVLAEFLALDLIPTAYRPTRRQRDHRVLVRWRVTASRRCSRLKVRMRQVLANYNADRTRLFTAEGMTYLREVSLSVADRFVMNQLLEEWGQAQEQLKAAEKQLQKFAEQGPKTEQEARRVLRTIPGVGEVTAEVVLAELAGVERFRSLKQVTGYAGLAPGHRESAGKKKELGISKAGSKLLRWILVEAAWSSVRYSLLWRHRYEELKKRCGAKKAIVAVARRLLSVMASMLRSGQAYCDSTMPEPKTARKKKKNKKEATVASSA